MHQPELMGLPKRSRHLRSDGQGAGPAHRAFPAQRLLECLALEQLQRHEVGAVVGAPVIVERHRIRVLQLGRHARFEEEPVLVA